MRSMSSGLSSALLQRRRAAAARPMLDVVSSGPATCRSRMPVRERIHESLVATTASRSWLVRMILWTMRSPARDRRLDCHKRCALDDRRFSLAVNLSTGKTKEKGTLEGVGGVGKAKGPQESGQDRHEGYAQGSQRRRPRKPLEGRLACSACGLRWPRPR